MLGRETVASISLAKDPASTVEKEDTAADKVPDAKRSGEEETKERVRVSPRLVCYTYSVLPSKKTGTFLYAL